MRIACLFLSICLCTGLFGQKRYKHTYEFRLKSIPSTYSIVYDSTVNRTGHLFFTAIDSRGDSVTMMFHLSVNAFPEEPGIPYQYSGVKTVYDLNLKPGSYSLSARHIDFMPLNIEPLVIYPNTTTYIVEHAGYMNGLYWGNIHSERALSREEIDSIIDHYSHRKTEEHLLIKQKVCYLLWEI